MSTPGTSFGRDLLGKERRHLRSACSRIPVEAIRDGLDRLKEWAR